MILGSFALETYETGVWGVEFSIRSLEFRRRVLDLAALYGLVGPCCMHLRCNAATLFTYPSFYLSIFLSSRRYRPFGLPVFLSIYTCTDLYVYIVANLCRQCVYA